MISIKVAERFLKNNLAGLVGYGRKVIPTCSRATTTTCCPITRISSEAMPRGEAKHAYVIDELHPE